MRLATCKILFTLTAAISFAPFLNAQTSVREPVARIGNQAVYDEDLAPFLGGQLLQLKNQEYELKSRALENLLGQRLVENEAKAKGLSAEVFLRQTVDPNVPPPTAAEIEAYYLAQKDRLNRPLNEIKPQLEQALIEAKRQQARQDYIDRLRSKADVSILLERPRMEVAADPQRVRGKADAPVTIVEFSDFQCPFCGAAEPTLKQVLGKYNGKVRLAFRDFPLRQIHPHAQQSAEAARCAGEEGKFWEYHDLLYAHQEKLDQAGLTAQAQAAGLDTQQFSACLGSGRFKAPIDRDVQAGAAAGISGTPAFYINGIPLSGAQPISEFEKIIDSELARLQPKNTNASGAASAANPSKSTVN